MPKLSIILPFYNAEKHIERAINSVLKQRFKDWELICIDDGSTDDTLKIVEKYGDKIRIIKSSHKGVAATRNIGVAAATGTFITYLDADDCYTNDALHSKFEIYDKDQTEGLKLVLCKSLVNFDSDELRDNYHLKVDDSNEAMLGILGATLMPIDVMKTVGPFKESLVTCSDYEWFMRLIDCKIKIIYNELVVLEINRHGKNLTNDGANIKKVQLEIFRNRIKEKKQ